MLHFAALHLVCAHLAAVHLVVLHHLLDGLLRSPVDIFIILSIIAFLSASLIFAIFIFRYFFSEAVIPAIILSPDILPSCILSPCILPSCILPLILPSCILSPLILSCAKVGRAVSAASR